MLSARTPAPFAPRLSLPLNASLNYIVGDRRSLLRVSMRERRSLLCFSRRRVTDMQLPLTGCWSEPREHRAVNREPTDRE